MSIKNGLIAALNDVLRLTGDSVQNPKQVQKVRDWREEDETFSVEAIVADTLTNLVTMGFKLRIKGENERARLIAEAAREFSQGTIEKAISISFVTGDSITVPIWTGTKLLNTVIGRPNFRIATSRAGEIMAVAYFIDEKTENLSTLQLVQVLELVDYEFDGGTAKGVQYTTRVLKNGKLYDGKRPEEWEMYEDYLIPNVNFLPIARYKCFQSSKKHPNEIYGTPLCFGASQPISDIHYYYSQLRNEFELSEKAVIADKAMFAKNADGTLQLPKGQDRLFMAVRGGSVDGNSLTEWAPSIQAQVYLDAIDAAERMLEKCIGVDSGILSKPNEINYANIDQVRKSMKNTQAFIDRARDEADKYIEQLLRAWDIVLNFYGLPTGMFLHAHDWSDDYLASIADKREAIVAGYAMGATDAYDYRVQVLGESPEIALERLEEIREGRAVTILAEE